MTRHPIDPAFEATVRTHLRAFADGAPTAVRDVHDLHPVTPARVPKRRLVGIGASVIALAGGLTLTGIAATGGEDRGSNSPEDAVREFVQAIEERDVLGALDVIDPGESDVMVDTVQSLVAEGSRAGVLDASADAGDVTGAAIDFSDLVLTTDQITTDLATVSFDGGTLRYSFDPAALPIAGPVRSEVGAALTRAGGTIDFATQPFRLATVSRNGVWYVSFGYSIAEAARSSADLPFPVDVPAAPQGFESPEAAATAFWTRLAALDVSGAIATAAPGEADALARYAPLWLPGLDRSIAGTQESGTSITVSDLRFDVTGDGDRRRVTPTGYVIDGMLPPASDDGYPSFDDTRPTLVFAADGSGFYLFDAGVPLPDVLDDVDLLPEFPAELMDGDGDYNSAAQLPDGSIERYWVDPLPATDPPSTRPFRLEYADGCTVTSGALVDDVLRWNPSAGGLDDLGDGRYRACEGQVAVGSFSVLAIFAIGRTGFATPEVPAVQTVEIDGQWYVAPVGTVADLLVDLLVDVPDGGILNLDSPLALFVYGTDLATLDTQLVGRAVDTIGTACEPIVLFDSTGTVTDVLPDAPRDAVRSCVESEGYWSFTGDGDDSAVSVEVGSDGSVTTETVFTTSED